MTSTERVAILLPLAVGAGAVLCTIFLHGLVWNTTLNFLRRERRLGRTGVSFSTDLAIVARTASLALAAHLMEIAVWAALFMICGQFSEFGTAYYHSAGNYTTLGSGLTMAPDWRLLGPLEAATGALMFGVSTAMIFGLIQRLVQTRFTDLD
jgi:hypothetical protein